MFYFFPVGDKLYFEPPNIEENWLQNLRLFPPSTETKSAARQSSQGLRAIGYGILLNQDTTIVLVQSWTDDGTLK